MQERAGCDGAPADARISSVASGSAAAVVAAGSAPMHEHRDDPGGPRGLPLSASVLAAKRVRASDSRPPCHW
jgi:hypothetical protein